MRRRSEPRRHNTSWVCEPVPLRSRTVYLLHSYESSAPGRRWTTHRSSAEKLASRCTLFGCDGTTPPGSIDPSAVLIRFSSPGRPTPLVHCMVQCLQGRNSLRVKISIAHCMKIFDSKTHTGSGQLFTFTQRQRLPQTMADAG